MLVHDTQDSTVSFERADLIENAHPGTVTLFTTTGLCYLRIPSNVEVVKAVVGFVAVL